MIHQMKARRRMADRGLTTDPPGAAPRLPSSFILQPSSFRSGFTLIELLVVIAIIAIVLSFVVVAAMDTMRSAEIRRTQALISKLEAGLNDRLESLMQNTPEPNWTHGYLATCWNSQFGTAPTLSTNTGLGLPDPANPQLKQTQRAQVFAWYDFLKSELPDVFFIQQDTKVDPGNNYPINFAGVPFPGVQVNGAPAVYAEAMLPLGSTLVNSGKFCTGAPGSGYGDGVLTTPSLGFSGSGIFGASYPIAAGIYKNLGVAEFGYDAVDNNNNSLIDEQSEGGGFLAPLLANHTHNTARSEMLYAILVEGQGPWGTVFNRDDFTDAEVQDTDGDGLPEFVDAWGQPLQFFRWPVLYHSDLQRGQVIVPHPTLANTWELVPPYWDPDPTGSVFQERERDPLDQNQQLTALQWWSQLGVGGQIAANNAFTAFAGPATFAPPGGPGASGGVQAFEHFFHRLTEPIAPGAGQVSWYWDRSGRARRSFYSKFLILSGGPDRQPGVFLYADADIRNLGISNARNLAIYLTANENNALPFGLELLNQGLAGFSNIPFIPTTTFTATPSLDPTHPSTYDLRISAQDDISNHNLKTVAAIGGS
jgi:prepilin-type N-terminal cleavage/methylation domain-containing protein